MNKLFFPLALAAGLGLWLASAVNAAPPATGRPTYLALKVYHLKNNRQEARIDSFLQRQYVPALHAAGIATIGVFKPLGNDTAADRRVYVLTPFNSLAQ